WFVGIQPPTDHENVNGYDPVPDFRAIDDNDENTTLIDLAHLPGQEKRLVISTEGIVKLGEVLAQAYFENR
ncbi:MAG: hypothetical protein AAF456_21890, partial [Planctomycetota bacterium]